GNHRHLSGPLRSGAGASQGARPPGHATGGETLMTIPTTPRLDAAYEIPEEERRGTGTRRREESYAQLVARLSHQSVVKHFDAYAHIPWDDPEFQIDPEYP